jgi:flavin reductase (DIM6/NTAB) family NADH-FMN oxidoreductase RutF
MTKTQTRERVSAGPTVAPKHLRKCLSRFTTGVTVVTYATAEGARGLTMNSFTSVSLDPPLILISLARHAKACNGIDGKPFAINVLRSDQMDVALQFAGKPQPGVRLRWEHDDAADPLAPSLADAVAMFHCTPWRRYDGGDHILHLGEVVHAETRPGDPLVFSDGGFATTGLPLLDGPLLITPNGAPAPSWSLAAHRFHHTSEI